MGALVTEQPFRKRQSKVPPGARATTAREPRRATALQSSPQVSGHVRMSGPGSATMLEVPPV